MAWTQIGDIVVMCLCLAILAVPAIGFLLYPRLVKATEDQLRRERDAYAEHAESIHSRPQN